MTPPPAKMWVLVGDQFACVKIQGRANLISSVDFSTLLNELRQKGFSYFVLELSECLLMDSTFLGVLAGLGMKMRVPDGSRDGPAIELLNPNPRIKELLLELGVLHLFKLTQGPLTSPAQTEVQAPAAANPSREQLKRACLEAHQTLMELNADNVSRFKDLTRFLAEDLKKLKMP